MYDELITKIVKEIISEVLKEVKDDDKQASNTNAMNTKEVAQYLGMSLAWVYQNTKTLPSMKIGKKLLFDKNEINEWKKQQVDEKNKQQKTIKIKIDKRKVGCNKVI